jgi:hypothetical protein
MRKIVNILLVIMAIAVAGTAIAKEAKEGEESSAAEPEKEDVSKLSDSQMTGKTEGTLTKLREVRKYVQNLLDQARKAKDIIKITCLNDKLTQINVNIRTYEDRIQSLSNAIKIGDKAARNHEYNVLTVLEQKITNLRMEADTCIGEAEGYLGKTEVTVTTPKGMAEMDPTSITDIGIEIIDRPPPASAFQ